MGNNEFFHFAADFFHIDAQIVEGGDGNPRAFFDESEENVLGADVVMVKTFGFLLREGDNFPGAICEFIEHVFPWQAAAWLRQTFLGYSQ